MRHAEYADELIVEAGLQIQAEGRPVTKWALKERVGGGNTSRLLAVWQAHELKTSKTETLMQDLPADIARELDSAIGAVSGRIRTVVATLQQKALEAAEQRVAQIEARARADADQARNEQADAEVLVAKLEGAIAAQERRLEEVQARLTASDQGRHDAALSLATVKEQLRAEKESHALFDAEVQMERDRVRELENDRENARKTEMTLREQLAHVTGQVEELRLQVRQPASTTPT